MSGIFIADPVGDFDVAGAPDDYSAFTAVTVIRESGQTRVEITDPEIETGEDLALFLRPAFREAGVPFVAVTSTGVELGPGGAVAAGDVRDALRLQFPESAGVANVVFEFELGPGQQGGVAVTEVKDEAQDAQEIAYLYEAALNRNGNIDEGGLNFWIDQLFAGQSREAIAEEFLTAPEFERNFGVAAELTDREIVDLFYQNILGRGPDDAGRQFWLNALEDPNFDRADLLLAFANVPENIAFSPYVDLLEEGPDGQWDFVVPPAQTEVFAGELVLEDDDLEIGEVFDFAFDFGNLGFEDVRVNWGLYLSENDSITRSDFRIAGNESRFVAAGESRTLVAGEDFDEVAIPLGTGTTPLQSGPYFLGILLDPLDELVEILEENNGTRPIPVELTGGLSPLDAAPEDGFDFG